MKLLKLAVYGTVGYLVYRTFFAESAGGLGLRRSRGNERRGQGGAGNSAIGSQGKVEETEDTSGTSVKHRVGRGVI
jgi:hypothetical protein